MNKKHSVISNLDIFANVGKAAAYDEVTRFQILNGQLIVEDETSDFKGTLSVEFSKVQCYAPSPVSLLRMFRFCTCSMQGSQDNPKVNAIVLLRGPVLDTGMLELYP